MINFLKKFNQYFEIKFGWFFINGNMQQKWIDYLNKKYAVKK